VDIKRTPLTTLPTPAAVGTPVAVIPAAVGILGAPATLLEATTVETGSNLPDPDSDQDTVAGTMNVGGFKNVVEDTVKIPSLSLDESKTNQINPIHICIRQSINYTI